MVWAASTKYDVRSWYRITIIRYIFYDAFSRLLYIGSTFFQWPINLSGQQPLEH